MWQQRQSNNLCSYLRMLGLLASNSSFSLLRFVHDKYSTLLRSQISRKGCVGQSDHVLSVCRHFPSRLLREATREQLARAIKSRAILANALRHAYQPFRLYNMRFLSRSAVTCNVASNSRLASGGHFSVCLAGKQRHCLDTNAPPFASALTPFF